MVRIFSLLLFVLAFSTVSWGQEGDVETGLTYAQSACSECHAIRRGSSPSPNPAAPTFEKIAHASGLTAATLNAVLQRAHSGMIIPQKADIVAYLLSLRR